MSSIDYQGIRSVLWMTIWLNLLATLAKLLVGILNNSLSLIADGLDSVFDSATSIIGLAGITFAMKPADAEYPYGRQKAETVSALIISITLFLTTWELIQGAINRIIAPTQIQLIVNGWTYVALGTSILIHVGLVRYQRAAGKRLHSDILVASAMNERGDIFVSVAVAVGLTIGFFGVPLADPIMALVVAAFIAKIGIDLVRTSTPTLMDKVKMPAQKVEQIALSIPGIVSVHHVRSRGHEQAVFADLHIRVDPTLSTTEAHSIAHELQRRLIHERSDLQDVTIHVEPAEGPIPRAPAQENFAQKLRSIASKLGLTVHDVWGHAIGGQYYIEAHLEVDGSMTLRAAHDLASQFEEEAKKEVPNLMEVTTHIEPRGKLIGDEISPTNEDEIAQLVEVVLENIPGGATVHEVQVYRSENGWDLSLHCNLPGDMPLAKAHEVSATIETHLRERIGDLENVVIHTEPFGDCRE